MSATIEYIGERLTGAEIDENKNWSCSRILMFKSADADAIQILQQSSIPRIDEIHPTHTFLHCTSVSAEPETADKGDVWYVTCVYGSRYGDGGEGGAEENSTKPWKLDPYNVHVRAITYDRVMKKTYKVNDEGVITDTKREKPSIEVLNTAGMRLADIPTYTVKNTELSFTYNVHHFRLYNIKKFIDTVNKKDITIIGIDFAPHRAKINDLQATFIPMKNSRGVVSSSASFWKLDIILELATGKELTTKIDSYGFEAKDSEGKVRKLYETDTGERGFLKDLKTNFSTSAEYVAINSPLPLNENGTPAITNYIDIGEPYSMKYYPYWGEDWTELHLPKKAMSNT